MTRTTAEWELILDDIAEGPWMATEPPFTEDNPPEIFTVDGALVFRLSDTDYPLSAETNMDAIAETPDLIAEVIRMRRELENLQKWIAQFPINPVLLGTGNSEVRANELQTKAVTAITLILNGDHT